MMTYVNTTNGPAILTTDHAMSSYGVPVLVMGGKFYGPDSMILPDWSDGYPQIAREIAMTRAERFSNPAMLTPADRIEMDELPEEIESRQRFATLLEAFKGVAR